MRKLNIVPSIRTYMKAAAISELGEGVLAATVLSHAKAFATSNRFTR